MIKPKTPSTYSTTLTLNDTDVEVVVEYFVIPGSRGSRDSLSGVRGAGPPLEPDTDPELEIITVKDDAGNELEVGDNNLERIEERIWDHLADQASDVQDYDRPYDEKEGD